MSFYFATDICIVYCFGCFSLSLVAHLYLLLVYVFFTHVCYVISIKYDDDDDDDDDDIWVCPR